MQNIILEQPDKLQVGEYKKVLNFNDLILSNIGYVIGAGIFVLIGKTINITGHNAWISVIISGLFIYFISNSYIKVHLKYLSNDAEYLAIKDKYGAIVSDISIVITIISIIAIIYVVLLGFGSYCSSMFGNTINPFVSSLIGLLFAVIINIYGIELTTNINSFFTLLGIIGLCLLIILGFIYIFSNWKTTLPNFITNDTYKNTFKNLNIINILYGAFIFVFAYFGFELIIRLNAESENNEKDIPEAIKYSIWITIIIYTLIAIIIIGVFGGDINIIGNNIKPLSILINKLTKNNLIIKYIELCGVGLTWNTILLSITYGSRLLTEFVTKISANSMKDTSMKETGIEKSIQDKSILENIIYMFKNINKYTNTPINSIILISLFVVLLLLLKVDIISSTIIANSGCIIIMMLVYLSS